MTDPTPPLTRAQKVDAELNHLYAQVPAINCKGLCTDSCGPVDGGAREVVRMRRAGVTLPPAHEGLRLVLADPGYRCPALVDGACSTYGVRPMICRVWGASEDLPCPYGCRPEPGTPLLSSAETQHLVDAARKAGTSQEPVSVAEMERRLAVPAYGSAYRDHVRKPTATRGRGPMSETVWVEVPADWVRVQGLFTFVGEPGRAVMGPVLAIEPDAPGDPAELRRLKDAVCVGCMEREAQRDQWAENSRLNGVKTEQAKEAWYREKDRADQADAEVRRLHALFDEAKQSLPAEQRRLLAISRMVFDGIAEGRPFTRDEAADLAQRIVDETGHSVTDEPALGPSFRVEIKRLGEQNALLIAMLERIPEVHMRFHVVDGELADVCADWCYACKLGQAEAERDQALVDLETARGWRDAVIAERELLRREAADYRRANASFQEINTIRTEERDQLKAAVDRVTELLDFMDAKYDADKIATGYTRIRFVEISSVQTALNQPGEPT